VHDRGEAGQGRVVAEVMLVDEYLECAQFPVRGAAVGVGGAFGVEGVAAVAGGDVEDLVGGDEQDLRVGVDEAADQPGAGDPVGFGSGAGDPFSWDASGGCAGGCGFGQPDVAKPGPQGQVVAGFDRCGDPGG